MNKIVTEYKFPQNVYFHSILKKYFFHDGYLSSNLNKYEEMRNV
jgi:hypothetical protein